MTILKLRDLAEGPGPQPLPLWLTVLKKIFAGVHHPSPAGCCPQNTNNTIVKSTRAL